MKQRAPYSRRDTLPYEVWSDAEKLAWRRAFPDEFDAAEEDDVDEFSSPEDGSLELAPEDLHRLRHPLQATERYKKFLSMRLPHVAALPFEDQFEEEPLRAFCRSLPGETNEQRRTIVDYLARLFRVRRALRKEPAAYWQKGLIREVGYRATPPKAPPLSTKTILDIGITMMDRAVADLTSWRRKNGSRSAVPLPAIAYRNGLFIAMLALLALRMANMISLEIGGSFILRTTDGPYRTLTVNYKSRTRKRILRIVPKALLKYIDTYLDVIRPELLQGAASDRFWIDKQRTPLGYSGGYAAFVNSIAAYAGGEHMNPHLVRHAAADVLRAAGASDEEIARMLGHQGLATASRYYLSLERAPKRNLCTSITGV